MAGAEGVKLAVCDGATPSTSPTFWGKGEEAHQKAVSCRDKLEKETGLPHSIKFSPKVRGANPVEPFYYVFQLSECREDARYSDYFGPNADNARKCADALERITGKYHFVALTRRSLFADITTVMARASNFSR